MVRRKPASKSSGETRPVQGLHFLVSYGKEKPDAQVRKLIRSHVMVGKNLGKTLPPRKKKDKPQKGLKDSPFSQSNLELETSFPRIPRKLGSNASTIFLADTVELKKIDMILNFSSIAKQLLYPLASCMFFDRRADVWIAPLSLDPAYLHTLIFTTNFYFSKLQNSCFRKQDMLIHYVKALKLLQERFAGSDDRVKVSDSTFAAVMSLTGYAFFTGNFGAARNHLNGLSRLVEMRGGVEGFKDSAKILIEIFRNDIGISLHTGSKPIFFSDPSFQEPILPYPHLKLFLPSSTPRTLSPQTSPLFFDEIDGELLKAWNIISDFCSVIEHAASSKLLISTQTFLEAMASVIYRLLSMEFPKNSRNEAIRLGLLATSCSIFLPWRSIGLSYPHFAAELKGYIINYNTSQWSSGFHLWLLMISAISVFDTGDDQWLYPQLNVGILSCGIARWEEMKDLLSSVLWIGLVHDKRGREIFDTVII